VLTIDISNLAYASAYVPALSALSHEGQATGVLFGALMSVLGAMRRNPKALPVLLWDGKAKWREELYPPYKSHRADTPEKRALRESVRQQSLWIREFAEVLGLVQVSFADAEADDVAGMLARAAHQEQVPLRMLSSDTDWWQVLGEYVDWESPRDFRIVNVEGLKRLDKKAPAGGWSSPQEYLEAKILAGDDSDEIEGVEGVGLITAAKMLRTSTRGLQGVLEGEFSAKGVVAERLRTPESREIIERNRKLMDWSLGPLPQIESASLWWGSFQEQAAARMARQYGLFKLESTLKQWEAHPRDTEAWQFVVQALEQAQDYGSSF
jgi:5'-3' exonuclease